ncbi:MAG: hypothetical protein IT531_09045 [Burkholderiales bacterium]|nr:hypothetical protein [Burkholderiales bacterium]
MSSFAPDDGVPPRGGLLRDEQALSGVKDYAAALDGVLALALGRIRIFDRALGLDYNAPARIETLRAFLLANRANRIAIVVHEPERIRTRCPRLVTLQRQFSYAVSIHRTLSLARNVYDPFCVVDGSHYVRRFHFDSLRGVLVRNDADGAAELVRRFGEIWEASQPAVTATTLGL